MSPAYTIELASKCHVRAIAGIEQAVATIFSEKDLPAELRYRVTDQETLYEAQRQNRLWSALANRRQPVGFALARIVGRYAHLEEMDVHPDFGKQGIGSSLLSAVIKWASDSGYPGITLITFRHVLWNAPFYERHGFVHLDDSNTSSNLKELIREDADAGIEPRNRVAMLRVINDGSGLAGDRPRA